MALKKQRTEDEVTRLPGSYETGVRRPVSLMFFRGRGLEERLLGICFLREARETAVGADRMAGKRGLVRPPALSTAFTGKAIS